MVHRNLRNSCEQGNKTNFLRNLKCSVPKVDRSGNWRAFYGIVLLTDRAGKCQEMYSWSCGIRRAANRNGRKRYCKWLFLRGGADPTLDAPFSLRSARWGLLILERAPVAVRGGLFCRISDIGNDGGGCVFDGRKLFNIDKLIGSGLKKYTK